VKRGFTPIIQPVVQSPKIRSKFAILRNKSTGHFEVIYDFRAKGYSLFADLESEIETVIGFKNYYPHHFENPYAAYLIPADIEVGETVWIEDVIEDIVQGSWNQGDTFRLNCCEATWDGTELIINFKPRRDNTIMVG
jgi:hypothetical protein